MRYFFVLLFLSLTACNRYVVTCTSGDNIVYRGVTEYQPRLHKEGFRITVKYPQDIVIIVPKRGIPLKCISVPIIEKTP